MENYQDTLEEFSLRQENLYFQRDKKVVVENQAITKDDTNAADEGNISVCDESLGYAHHLDEFQHSDKHKRVPRTFYAAYPKVENSSHVNMPKFKVSRNPFQLSAPQIFVLTAGAPEICINTNTAAEIAVAIASPLDFFIDLPQITNNCVTAAPTLNQQTSNGTTQRSNRSDSYDDVIGDADNEIINQIASQFPELLDKSDMREICLTPSLVDGLKQQAGGIYENENCDGNDKPNNNNRHSLKKNTRAAGSNSDNLIESPNELVIGGGGGGVGVFISMNRLSIDEQSQVDDLITKTEGEHAIPPPDDDVIFTLVKREFEFHPRFISKDEILKTIAEYSFISAKDESRANCSNKEGGKECKDKKIKECLRNIGTEVIKQVGRKLLSGSFNLTQVSFPIRAMIPQTILEKAFYSTCLFPLYVNKAAATTNLVERFKFLICATLGNFYINCGFLKPLNPILGETCRAVYLDGTKLYAEQISHHPPVSYFTVYGPEKSYCMYGNYNQEVNAGLNSVKLKNRGSRHIRFKDGQYIAYNFAKETYSGSFMGTMKVESKGCITFKDEANGIIAEIEIGAVKKKPTDYLAGTIKVNGVVVSNVFGTYMGFLEFDAVRYWDYRYVVPFEPLVVQSEIGSDQSHRLDKKFLLQGDIPTAQRHKENLENIQRSDAKLRKKHSEAVQKSKKKQAGK